MNEYSRLATSYVTPRMLRAFNALPGNAVTQGASVALVLLVLFIGGQLAG